MSDFSGECREWVDNDNKLSAEGARFLRDMADEFDRLKNVVAQVDDFLCINHIAAKDGDYRTALIESEAMSIKIHDDTAVSAVARDRQENTERLEKQPIIRIAAGTKDDPFRTLECEIIDEGVADRIYVVSCAEFDRLERDNKALNVQRASICYRLETVWGIGPEVTGDIQSWDHVTDLAAYEELEKELEAYKKAKAENDERFMLERDEARKECTSLSKQLEAAQDEIYRAKELADGYHLDRDGAKNERDEYRKVLEFYAHDMLYFPRTIVLECQAKNIPLAPIYAEFGDAARLALGMPTTKPREDIEAMKSQVLSTQQFRTRMGDAG